MMMNGVDSVLATATTTAPAQTLENHTQQIDPNNLIVEPAKQQQAFKVEATTTITEDTRSQLISSREDADADDEMIEQQQPAAASAAAIEEAEERRQHKMETTAAEEFCSSPSNSNIEVSAESQFSVRFLCRRSLFHLGRGSMFFLSLLARFYCSSES